MDEKLATLFKEWLVAFEAIQAAKSERAVTAAHTKLAAIEARIASDDCIYIPGDIHRRLPVDEAEQQQRAEGERAGDDQRPVERRRADELSQAHGA